VLDVAIQSLCRRDGARVLASLIARLGDFDRAQDALQDAYAQALVAWRREGLPARPAAWLFTVALRRGLDALRHATQRHPHDSAALEQLRAPDALEIAEDALGEEDLSLRLIFTCCHPALAPSAQIVLTLRCVCQLDTREIARALLEPEATTAQKIVRAKRKIAEARIPYQVPEPAHWPERLAGVLATIYLVFNAGYTAREGETLQRVDLCEQALALTHSLCQQLPDEPEVLGLTALLALHHARGPARMNAQGELVPLEEQDRARWDRAAIAQATTLLDRAVLMRRPGPYQIQAAIAALHAQARRAEDTDWAQIVALYTALRRHLDTPVVALNAAAALAMAHGPQAGLDAIARIETQGELRDYHLLHAARADLLRRLGRVHEAAAAYCTARALTRNRAEIAYLDRRLAELNAATAYPAS
jgi:RNA polymerase sigma-70 factor (ECF subfamily)